MKRQRQKQRQRQRQKQRRQKNRIANKDQLDRRQDFVSQYYKKRLADLKLESTTKRSGFFAAYEHFIRNYAHTLGRVFKDYASATMRITSSWMLHWKSTSDLQQILVEAAREGDIETVKQIGQIGRVNLGCEWNRALTFAASYNHVEVVQYLLTHPTVHPSDGGRLVCNLAASKGHDNVVSILLADGRLFPAEDGIEPFLVAFSKRVMVKGKKIQKVTELLLQSPRFFENGQIPARARDGVIRMIRDDTIPANINLAALIPTQIHDPDVRAALSDRHDRTVLRIATIMILCGKQNMFHNILPPDIQTDIVVEHFGYALFPDRSSDDKRPLIEAMMQRLRSRKKKAKNRSCYYTTVYL